MSTFTNRPWIAAVALVAGVVGAATATAQNWYAEVARSDTGHLVGKQGADISLIEFFSYTCPACGRFAAVGDGALQIAYIGTGKAQVEYRPMVRDPIDLTLTMMVDCGGPEKFTRNHAAVFARQGTWLVEAQKASAGAKELWKQGLTSASARRTIASSLDLYDIFAGSGIDRPLLDRCLADQSKADALLAAADQNRESFGKIGTPSFAIDGVLLAGTHDWSLLEPQLNAWIAQKASASEAQ